MCSFRTGKRTALLAEVPTLSYTHGISSVVLNYENGAQRRAYSVVCLLKCVFFFYFPITTSFCRLRFSRGAVTLPSLLFVFLYVVVPLNVWVSFFSPFSGAFNATSCKRFFFFCFLVEEQQLQEHKRWHSLFFFFFQQYAYIKL